MNRLNNNIGNGDGQGSVPQPLIQVYFAGLTPDEQDLALEYLHELYREHGGSGLAVTHWDGFAVGKKIKPGSQEKDVTPPKVPRPEEN